MTRTITRLAQPTNNPVLGRHVHHDSESRRYAYPTNGLTITSVRHAARIPILDQGQRSSCTGNAGIGCLGTDPFYDTVTDQPRYPFTEDGAVELYSVATTLDGFPGQYPPTDTGSSGLAVAKALQAAGLIAGYLHTFSLEEALKALGQVPLITGINWTTDMFHPDAEGIIHPTGPVAGGHELVVDEYDAARDLVGFRNSWSPTWGLGGRCYMPSAEWGTLLEQQGDVTVFVPRTQPAPVPAPSADDRFATVLHPWVLHHHIGDNGHVATEARVWLAARGL